MHLIQDVTVSKSVHFSGLVMRTPVTADTTAATIKM